MFVVRGDLTQLTCDAWLLPTDAALRVAAKWHHALGPGVLDGDRLRQAPPPGWGRGGPCAFRLGGRDRPAVWPTDVGGDGAPDIGWIRRALATFIDSAAGDLAGLDAPAAGRRARPALAVPVVGTGGAGGHHRAGDLLAEVVAELDDAVARTGLDVVLVTNEEHTFAAAQAARRHRPRPDPPPSWSGAVEALARRARRGELTLLIGGGVSMGAGLPSWSELMALLAREAGMSDAELGPFAELDVLDQARIVQHRLLAGGVAPGDVLARLLDTSRVALAHALLASLPVDEVVTTNYDRLFERASEAAGRPVAVLPRQRSGPGGRWLLKLHGSIEEPGDIVLTREDYLRYGERRAALGGIVQALLITKHMLFVGFSLSDHNFHRIVDEVRRALRPEGAPLDEPFGTAVLLADQPLLEELWEGEVCFVPAGDPGDDRQAARHLEILLDRLVLESSDLSAHLLDDRFTSLLSEPEHRLRLALTELGDRRGELEDAPAWALVADLLRRLGWDG